MFLWSTSLLVSFHAPTRHHFGHAPASRVRALRLQEQAWAARPAWEEQAMPTYDYRNQTFPVILAGMSKIREDSGDTLALLEQLTERDFFSYFPVNLITPCMYFPAGDAGCMMAECEIRAARERDMPPALLARDREEYEFLIDGWVSKDMPSDFTEYFDLRVTDSRNTGYNGQRVWRFIHTNICFQKRLSERDMGWKRDFNRLISGMHAAVDCDILADIGLTDEGVAEYRRRLRDEPGAICNLYFAYMLTLCAIHDCRENFNHCGYLGDTDIQPLMRSLNAEDLLGSPPVQNAAANLREQAATGEAAAWKVRLRTRHLKLIMGCVDCNVCKVHGTVMVIGLASTLQVLLGDDGARDATRPDEAQPDPLKLDRVKIGALVATAAKFGRACATVERFRKFDGEDMSEAYLGAREELAAE